MPHRSLRDEGVARGRSATLPQRVLRRPCLLPLNLDATLALLLPTAEETALLRACLHSGESARAGWQTWRRGRSDDSAVLCEELATWRTLLPLLARSALRNEIDVGREVMSYLRATTAREELRSERYREIAATALTALAEADHRALVLRGAALAAGEYESWALRHCHDLDLLVDPGTLGAAVSTLMRAGFDRDAGLEVPRGDAVVEHASGMQVALHTRPFAIAYHDAAGDAFVRGSRSITFENRSVRVPAAEATLVHALGHATYSPSRRNLRWVCDAWQIVARHRELDWRDVLDRIAEHRLALPVATLVEYLARFGMEVPGDIVASLRERAARADRAAVDVALGGLASGTRGDVLGIWRSARGWRARLEVARWATAPTPAYLRSACDVRARWLLPLLYVYRPARFVAGRLAWRSASAAAGRAARDRLETGGPER